VAVKVYKESAEVLEVGGSGLVVDGSCGSGGKSGD
jgi:hypothetical protein